MKTGTSEHLKYKQLKMLLKLPQYAVTGVLEELWQTTARSAPDGDIGRFTNKMIAAGMEWAGNADELIEALVDSGWLDSVDEDEGRLVVHDWHDHCPDYIKKRQRRTKQTNGRTTADKNVQRSDSGGQNEPTGGQKAETSAIGAIAKPSQAKPSQEESAQSGDCSPPPVPKQDQLDVLIDSWNELGPDIAPKVQEREAEPIIKGWKAVQRTPRVRKAFDDIPALMQKIRDGTFLHKEGWFKLEWLFTKGKSREWNVLKILDGNYKENNHAKEKTETKANNEAARKSLKLLDKPTTGQNTA